MWRKTASVTVDLLPSWPRSIAPSEPWSDIAESKKTKHATYIFTDDAPKAVSDKDQGSAGCPILGSQIAQAQHKA